MKSPVMLPEGTGSCCRCGAEFARFGTERVCPVCRKPKSRASRAADPASPLSPRQTQVIRLVGEAKLNKEIAAELHLSEGTVKEYLNKIYRKLKVRNRTDLALWALRNSPETKAIV